MEKFFGRFPMIGKNFRVKRAGEEKQTGQKGNKMSGWSAGGMSTLKTMKTASRTGTRLESGWGRQLGQLGTSFSKSPGGQLRPAEGTRDAASFIASWYQFVMEIVAGVGGFGVVGFPGMQHKTGMAYQRRLSNQINPIASIQSSNHSRCGGAPSGE
ncbi:MAG: hypothetical protein IKQ55_09650 [Kiritimatiellae bacterium]|nr:hypothetical protein [Kiritimatiellia bacterium]